MILGVRQESIEVSLEFIAAPLDYEQDATATYQSSTGTGVLEVICTCVMKPQVLHLLK